MSNLGQRITKLEEGRAAKGVSLPMLVYSITDKQGHSCGQYMVAITGKFGQYRNPTPEETQRLKSMAGQAST